MPEKIAAVVKEVPKVKRQIEVEGGKTDAKANSLLLLESTY